MFCYDYKCDRCQLHVETAVGVIGYDLLENGNKLPTLTSPAWCDCCETVTSAERLPSIETLNDALSKYRAGILDDADTETAALLNMSIEAFTADRIKSITDRWLFLSTRDSPGCCIECGTHSFHFLTDETEDGSMPSSFVHPICGGEMQIVRICHASPATYFLLDLNGTRIDARTSNEAVYRSGEVGRF